MGPFTEVGFKTGDFNIHPTREPYNSAMENSITRIDLKDFVTYDIPEGVVEIDLLYKPENSTTVFSLDTIKPKKRRRYKQCYMDNCRRFCINS